MIAQTTNGCNQLKVNDTKVFEQYFDAHQYQYDAARQLRLRFEPPAENAADAHAYKRYDKCGDADGQHSRYDGNLKECKGDADCQRVDAGREGEDCHAPKPIRAACARCRTRARFTYHIDADDGQKCKRNPVIHFYDVVCKLCAQQISKQRHQCLKSTEVSACDG